MLKQSKSTSGRVTWQATRRRLRFPLEFTLLPDVKFDRPRTL